MDPLTMMIIGAALGGVKTVSDVAGRASDKKKSGAQTRWSPWTGMTPEPVRNVDTIGNLLKGGMTGAMASNLLGLGAAPVATDAAALAELEKTTLPNMWEAIRSVPQGSPYFNVA